jgi:hypothetical protein
MTVPISNVPRRVVLAASGTGPYSFNFEILAASDIAVYEDDTLLTLTTDYTVTINTNGTGSVTLTSAATGSQIAIVGDRTIARATDFTTGGDLFASSLNEELDQQTIFNQQNAEAVDRALKVPVTDPVGSFTDLPPASLRAGKYLAFDGSGNPLAAAGTSETSPVSSAMAPVVSGSTLSVARAAMGLGTMSTQNANNVAITGGTIAGVTLSSSNATITGGTITGITDLTVADGGTGRSTLTAENVLLGDGTNAVKFVAPGTTGNVLTSNGTTWTSAAAPTLTLDDTKVPNVTAGTKYFPITTATLAGTVDQNTLTKIASARVLRTGTYNFRLRLRNGDAFNALQYSRIYANGSALGTEQSSTINAGVYGTQTHTNISLTRGDIVQLYVRTASVVDVYSWQAGVDEDIGFLPITMASTNDNLTSAAGLPL